MTAINSREAIRFVVSGGLSTLCNLAAVAVARLSMSYDLALLCGIAAGLVSSFLLTKLFAFRARAWSRSGREAGRFLLVYGFGLALYYLTALLVRSLLVSGLGTALADLSGVLAGAGVMTVTGYFGHRHFTYRTARGEGS